MIQDHPRVCGEKLGKRDLLGHRQGSPPRMRGKEALSNMIARTIRITPAYAGKSPAGNQQNRQGGDHPRVCGEKGIEDADGFR